MPTLVKNGSIIADDWVFLETTEGNIPVNAIVPFDALPTTDARGCWIASDFELETHAKRLIQLDVLAVNFVTFADGTGLSLVHLLRTRYGYSNELRAIGAVEPDLTPFMLRSGFDSFELSTYQRGLDAIECQKRASVFYQGSASDSEPSYRKFSRPVTTPILNN